MISSWPADSSRDPERKNSDRGVLSWDDSKMARCSFCSSIVSVLCQFALGLHRTHSSMTEFYTKSLAVDMIRSVRVMAAANRGYLQIRLGDIHKRFPCVEAFINKGIVITRQIQSLEQQFESRHTRAEAPGFFEFMHS